MADTYPKNTIDDNGLKKVWDMVMDRLGLKVDKEAGKGLSTNDYTTTEKDKLAGIASGAEVNTVTSVAGKTGAVTLDKSDVGLSNVGNFKAVSTSANQGLTDTEKSNARVNIDTPSNGDIQSSKTLKSSVVTVTDAAPINAEDITVDITPIQDLHGYDRPWAGGAGKNKYDGDRNVTGTGGTRIIPNNYALNLKLGTYTAVFKLDENPSNSASVQFVAWDADNNVVINATKQISIGENFLTGTAESDIARVTIYTNNQNSGTYSDIMILNGDTPDYVYAPYSNICPIEGWTGAELDRVGKNLCNWKVSETSNALSMALKPNKYVISAESTLPEGNWYIRFTDSSGEYSYSASDVGLNAWAKAQSGWFYGGLRDQSVCFIVPKGCTLVEIGKLSQNGTVNAQLELGSTATTYEPYQGEQYTASFGEVVYGGKWHVTEGGTDKAMREIDLGSLSWGYSRGEARFYASVPGIKSFSYTETANILCDCYRPAPWASSTNGDIFSADGYVSVKDNRYTTTSDFKAAVTGQKLVYEKATPTTISTPKQNVPMLQGINTVYADCGDVSLKYQPDNVVGELKGDIRTVEAELAEAEANLEIVYEDHVANTSMGIIVDGYSVGDMPFSNALDIAKTGYTPIAVTDTSIVHSTVATQGEIATHCLLDVTNNRVRFYVHVMDSAASLTIPPNSLTFRVAYKKA